MARVVIVDDEPDIVTLVSTKLRNAGHEIHVATDGAAGLDLVREVMPDLVLLDAMMPKMDGFEVSRRIRAHFGPAPPPVVVLLSARSQHADRQRGLDAGGDDYITKPFRPADLLARVSELLERQVER
jgi:two-component system OmpR family response regulator